MRTLGTGEDFANGYKLDKVQQVWERQHEVRLQQWLDYAPENEEQGRVQGNLVEPFVGWRNEIEVRLMELRLARRREQRERVQLASVQAGEAVLQTVTVPLNEVRAHPEEWKPSFQYGPTNICRSTSSSSVSISGHGVGAWEDGVCSKGRNRSKARAGCDHHRCWMPCRTSSRRKPCSTSPSTKATNGTTSTWMAFDGSSGTMAAPECKGSIRNTVAAQRRSPIWSSCGSPSLGKGEDGTAGF